jgi:hypothetical protein
VRKAFNCTRTRSVNFIEEDQLSVGFAWLPDDACLESMPEAQPVWQRMVPNIVETGSVLIREKIVQNSM